MGHVRLGRLPKSLRWRGVVQLLDDSADDVPAVARATAYAAEERLRQLARDPSLGYCFWLLTRISAAAVGGNTAEELEALGLRRPPTGSMVAFLSLVSDRVRQEAARHPESGPFAELASLALRRALSETVGQHTTSLFGGSVDDLDRALRPYSTPRRFGVLARGFFGDFFARTLRFFVDRELSNVTGPGHMLSSLEASRDFSDALDVYARQSAVIMERFAADWYSKHNWESSGRIGRDEAQRFVAVALRKMRAELALSA